ncbi:unnamed protein product [Trichogramma brassicae]|uniref:Uncharacterized protein n=1 Tax=Trichogramma brassicae TaxID=86971 RepID=A0A6H5J9M5_9HYME|nr:unnamed protein product [Trichogramma brassicae]
MKYKKRHRSTSSDDEYRKRRYKKRSHKKKRRHHKKRYTSSSSSDSRSSSPEREEPFYDPRDNETSQDEPGQSKEDDKRNRKRKRTPENSSPEDHHTPTKQSHTKESELLHTNNNESSQDVQDMQTKDKTEKPEDVLPLDDDVLQVIGKRLTADKSSAAAIPNEICVRLQEINETGLPEDERKQLMEKYPQASNCRFLEAPKLNLEIKTILQSAIINRDNRIMLKQGKVAVCLAALTSLLTKLSKKEKVDSIFMIQSISDACRILVDLQRDESLTRKSLILPQLNTTVKAILDKETNITEFLFGNELEEKLRSAKTREKSTKELLQNPKELSKENNKQHPKNSSRPFREYHKQDHHRARSSRSGLTSKSSYHQQSRSYKNSSAKQEPRKKQP